jgi:hypothetical protein
VHEQISWSKVTEIQNSNSNKDIDILATPGDA